MITVEFIEHRGWGFAPMLRHECGGVSGPDTIAELRCKVRSTTSGISAIASVYFLPDEESPTPESISDEMFLQERSAALRRARRHLLCRLSEKRLTHN